MLTVGKKIRRIKNERGYTYVMVLVAVVIVAILANVGYELTSYQVKHDREVELLFRGTAYVNAIQSYYLSNPPGTVPTYPRNLTDLLSDPRYIHQRYIRALYSDPMGGDWNLVRSPDGGISGVVSGSKEKPLKIDNFPSRFSSFAGAEHYSDWIFFFDPSTISTASQNSSNVVSTTGSQPEGLTPIPAVDFSTTVNQSDAVTPVPTIALTINADQPEATMTTSN
jgi:type II secretory pathway pseudopilin PulG